MKHHAEYIYRISLLLLLVIIAAPNDSTPEWEMFAIFLVGVIGAAVATIPRMK